MVAFVRHKVNKLLIKAPATGARAPTANEPPIGAPASPHSAWVPMAHEPAPTTNYTPTHGARPPTRCARAQTPGARACPHSAGDPLRRTRALPLPALAPPHSGARGPPSCSRAPPPPELIASAWCLSEADVSLGAHYSADAPPTPAQAPYSGARALHPGHEFPHPHRMRLPPKAHAPPS
ncbi:unnamed protein product [Rangifer tarandus platyrhynchus]|uniref:Uncharacterized protein n=1 Tax=Rangifer tarandus platyrhynchus TaxID=3082113 RepID=A0ABN9A4C8_RANTA|nr:unnamed protein product [Rangifer tarandus platyrhynchus]